MKVYIDGVLHDADDKPIFVVFEDDDARKLVAQQINDMPDSDGLRVYAMYPDEMKGNFDFMGEVEKIKELMKVP